MKKFYMLEHHPMDSRIKIDDSGTCQTLPARMGTGGGNVPLVILIDGERRHDYGTFEDGIAPTVTAKYVTGWEHTARPDRRRDG